MGIYPPLSETPLDTCRQPLPVTLVLPRERSMAKKGLTHIAIRNFKPRGLQYEVSDLGCAGLRVVVFPSGAKSYIVRYRSKEGLQRKLTLGKVSPVEEEHDKVPVVGDDQTLASARVLATQVLQDARRGNDWTQKKRQEKAAVQAAEAAAQAAETDTLRAVADKYLRLEGDKLRSVDMRRSDLDLACDVLGKLPV